MVEFRSAFSLGFLRGVFWEGGGAGNTKRPDMGCVKNPTRPGRKSSCGTGGGPHGQSQVNNLVNGVIPRSSRITDATKVKDGACGTKLHERVR